MRSLLLFCGEGFSFLIARHFKILSDSKLTITMFTDLKRIADATNRIAIGASVDRWGVPQLTRIIILDIDEARQELWFYHPDNSASIENLQYNPKASLSLTDIKAFEGRQVKGLADVAASATPSTATGRKLYADATAQGVKHFVRLRVAEIFDVVPKENSVRQPVWRGKAFDDYDRIDISYATFAPSKIQAVKINGLKDLLNPFLQAQFQRRMPSFVGTVEFRGAPNISPRWVVGAEDDFILWGDLFKNKTFFNFSRPSPLALYALDWDTGDAWDCQGWGKFFFFGKTVAEVNEAWGKLGFKNPMQAIHFFPEEAYRIEKNQRRQMLKGRSRADWLPTSTVERKFNLDALNLAQERAPAQKVSMPQRDAVSASPVAVMLSNELLAAHIADALKPDIDVKRLPIEDYDRSRLANAACLMTTLGNRATEVDLHYLRALLDAATFFSDAYLGRERIKFVVFVGAVEKSSSLRASLNALELFVKTLNQTSQIKVELAFIFLPPDAEKREFEADIRKKVLNAIDANESGELNYFTVKGATA